MGSEGLLLDQDENDLDIALRAMPADTAEIKAFVVKILANHLKDYFLDDVYLAGRFIVTLHDRYGSGLISPKGLDPLLDRLIHALEWPQWLVMRSRDCEYATDIDNFLKPFETEFAYTSELWAHVRSTDEFYGRYDRSVSNSHDIAYD